MVNFSDITFHINLEIFFIQISKGFINFTGKYTFMPEFF